MDNVLGRLSSRFCQPSIFGRAITLCVVVVFVFGTCLKTYSQQVTADAVGRVTDPSGAIIPNAQVSITNVGTNETRKTVTNEQGEFTFNLLKIGSYKARVEAPGFKRVEVPAFDLQVGERHRLDVPMTVGSQTEEVTVTSEAPALQTDSASVGQTLESQAVQDLPTEGRNLYSLVQLAPGASSGPANGMSSGQRPDDRRQASEVSANGQSDQLNNNLLDGMDNNALGDNIIEVRPSIDAIEELSVLTSSYPAEVGNVAGAVVNMLTKSGANDFHGTAYEYIRNDIFDGKDYFARVGSKPELRQNQFGGSFGGPIRRDKTFFFADAEDFRKVRAQTSTTTVPTLYEEQNPGDFTDNPNSSSYVPSYLIDPVGLAYFKLYPKPTTSGIVNNFTASPKGTQYLFTSDVRLDHHFNANNLMFGRYSYNKADTLTPGLFPEVNGIQPGGNVYGFYGTSHETAMNGMLDYTHIFKPNLILELKDGYTRFVNSYVTQNEGNNVSQTLGVSNINVNSANTGLAGIYPIGYASLGDATFEPGTFTYNTFQEAGILSYSKGSHSIKLGASLIRRQGDSTNLGSYPLGLFYFLYVPQLAAIGLPVNSLADVLYGVSVAGTRQENLVPTYARFWSTGEFIQDDWRVTPKLTLNLGLRYDMMTQQEDAQNHLANFDLATSELIVASNSNKTVGVKPNYANFAPRVGFSASVTDKTVVHGAFALSFFSNDTKQIMPGNPPFVSSFNASPVTLDSSNPFYAYFGDMAAPTSPGTNLSTYSGDLYVKPKNYPESYMEEFNLSVQQQFGSNVLTVAYVGELGRKLFNAGNYDIDIPAPSPLPNPASRAPYAATLPKVGAIYEYLAEGFSGYHGLQTSFTRHFTHGWSTNVNYTWAHSIDDVAGSSYSIEPYGLLPGKISTYDKGNSDLDLRQRISVTASYAFPFTKSFTGMNKAIFGGWQMNAVAFWQAGSPYTVEDGNPQINVASTSIFPSDRPNRYVNYAAAKADLSVTNQPLTSIKCMGSGNTGQCFAPQAFGTAGDSMKNILTGPHQRRVDLSIFRDFPFFEKTKLQFRAESYDVSNSPNFDQPNADISNAAFGTIAGSLLGSDQRVFQFALKFSY